MEEEEEQEQEQEQEQEEEEEEEVEEEEEISMGCAHGRAAQVAVRSKATHPPSAEPR